MNFDKIRSVIKKIVESTPVTIIMSLFTIWALFSTDIKLAGTNINADSGFDIVLSIAFFLFLFEIFLQGIYNLEYLNLHVLFEEVPFESFYKKCLRFLNFGSFYFYLDCIATISLIFDVMKFYYPFIYSFPFLLYYITYISLIGWG